MTTTTDAALVNEVTKVFKLACVEKDWQGVPRDLDALMVLRDSDAERHPPTVRAFAKTEPSKLAKK